MLGYCKLCDRFLALSPGKAITQRARDTGTTDKYPVQHAAPDRHVGCVLADGRHAVAHVVEGEHVCELCDRRVPPEELERGDADCGGRRVPI